MGAGVDLFEAFFPFQVTERGCALCFDFDISPDPERAGSAPRAGVVIKLEAFRKLFNLLNLKLWNYSNLPISLLTLLIEKYFF